MTHSEATARNITPKTVRPDRPYAEPSPKRDTLTGRRTAIGEWVAESSLFTISLISILALGLIMMFLLVEGAPTFSFVSIRDFVLGHFWYPTDEPPDFGILPLILGSVSVTLISSLIACRPV